MPHPFVYKRQIDDKATFAVHLRDNPEDKIIVNSFAAVVGMCFDCGFSPKLRAVKRFEDDWIMVVMDDISSEYREAPVGSQRV